MAKVKRRRRGAIYKPISFLLVCVAIVLAVSVFFKVSEVRTEGNALCPSENIIEASSIKIGDNLFLFNKFKAISRIFEASPYIENVRIKRVLPGTIVIEVDERAAMGCIFNGDSYWVIDKNCRIMERTDSIGAAGKISITGIELLAPTVGEDLAVKATDETKAGYLSEVMNALYDNGMYDKVTELDITNISNLTFKYDNRFIVKMGKYEKTEYKIGLLKSVLEDLSPGDSGTIDMSADKAPHVIPN